MAVEFDVKIPTASRAEYWAKDLCNCLTELGINEPFSVHGMKLALEAEETQGWAIVGEKAEISLMCHRAGDEQELGDDGGFWMTVSADRLRTGASALVALLTAIAIAKEVGSQVIDERCIFTQRRLEPRWALEQIRATIGDGDLSTLGAKFGQMLGLPNDGLPVSHRGCLTNLHHYPSLILAPMTTL